MYKCILLSISSKHIHSHTQVSMIHDDERTRERELAYIALNRAHAIRFAYDDAAVVVIVVVAAVFLIFSFGGGFGKRLIIINVVWPRHKNRANKSSDKKWSVAGGGGNSDSDSDGPLPIVIIIIIVVIKLMDNHEQTLNQLKRCG